jgi:iron complex outermembrane receptor protein
MRIFKLVAQGKLCIVLLSALCTTLLLGTTLAAQPAQARSVTYDLDIPAQSLNDALQAFALVSQHKLLYSSELVDGKKSPPLKGKFTAEQAVKALLSGSNLSYEVTPDGLVLIRAADPSPTTNSAPLIQDQIGDQTIRLAQATTTGPSTDNSSAREKQGVPKKEPKSSSSSEEDKAGLSEIVVTGTFLHHSNSITPVTTITQDDMLSQGYTTLTQVFEQLPQNFLNGASPASNPNNAAGSNSSLNYSYATGVNLRGLGPEATLVLLNGKRLAPTGNGSVVDISQIPVSLIDHVEILADGASSLYGSDAVAGVVNIVTKRDFSGFELSGRSNSISDGKTPNYGGDAVGGFGWDGGNVVLGLDFEKDNPLLASKRTWTQSLPDPFDLFPRNESTHFYASMDNRFTDQLSLTTDLLASHRTLNTEAALAGAPGTTIDEVSVNQYSIASQLDYKLPSDWTATLIGQASREQDTSCVAQLYEGYAVCDHPFAAQVASIEARADGPILQAPGGAVRLAIGAAFRRESFRDDLDECIGSGCEGVPGSGTPWTFNASESAESARHVSSAYGELLIPLIGDDNALSFTKRLRVSLSGRFDDYSDFGRTTNPRVAIDWVPIVGLTFHGSYSRSFQAPTLLEASKEIYYATTFNVPDPRSPTGTALGLILDGTNPNLQPETAKTFNVGMSYEPSFLSGLKLDASFFSIDFTNQINRLINTFGFSNWLEQANVLGPLVTQNPTVAQVDQALAGRSPVYNLGQCVVGVNGCPAINPAAVQAIANLGYVNSAGVNVRGVDLTGRYTGALTPYGRFRSDFSGTFYTTYQQQITPTAEEYSSLNTVYNPLRFRAKTNVAWDQGPWTINGRINYSPAYINQYCDTAEQCRVASWTTVDFSLIFSAKSSGLRASLDVSNAFNRAPPFLGTGYNTTGILPYDPTNANPLGRAFAITLTKRWGGS